MQAIQNGWKRLIGKAHQTPPSKTRTCVDLRVCLTRSVLPAVTPILLAFAPRSSQAGKLDYRSITEGNATCELSVTGLPGFNGFSSSHFLTSRTLGGVLAYSHPLHGTESRVALDAERM